MRKLIIPLILEQTLAITVGMADTMMISSAGEAAVSGVSLVDMFNNLIISVLAALATGGAVVTSQCIGAGRREEACRSARQLVFTEAAITIGISVLVLLFHRQILGLFFGQIEADVMQNAIIYLIISRYSQFQHIHADCISHNVDDIHQQRYFQCDLRIPHRTVQRRTRVIHCEKRK